MKQKTILGILFLVSAIFIPQVSRAELLDATNVLGQSDFISNTSATTQNGMNRPYGLALDSTHGRLFVADENNSRVLVYNVSGGVTDNMNAVNVLGQMDFVTATTGGTQNTMNRPSDVLYDSANNYLYVADKRNNRVLVFDVASITNGENAIHVLGQPDFTTVTPGLTQSKVGQTDGLALDATGERLFVTDYGNGRVLVFDVSAIVDGEPAMNVLGKPDFVSNTDATTQNGMSYSQDIAFDAERNYLFVTDECRVLVFDVSVGTITDGMNAINVLGEANFTDQRCTFSQTNISYPWGLGYDSENQHLFVGNEDDYRVQVWDVAEITDGETALAVLGHANFDDGYEANTTTRSTFNNPVGSVFDYANNRMFLADKGNNRILVFSPIPYAPIVPEEEVLPEEESTPEIITDAIDTNSKSYKLYKKYKEYRGTVNKAKYKKVKNLKKNNYTLYLALKKTYWKYKYLDKTEFNKLPQETQDNFNKYKKYRLYKKYQTYKEKVFGD